VPRWVRWYEGGGLAEVRAHRQGGLGPRPRLTAAQQEQVAAAVATGRFRSAAEIGVWIQTTVGVADRPGGVSALRARLRCGPKVPRPRHAQANLHAQAEWTKGALRRRVGRPA
jgi:transposase